MQKCPFVMKRKQNVIITYLRTQCVLRIPYICLNWLQKYVLKNNLFYYSKHLIQYIVLKSENKVALMIRDTKSIHRMFRSFICILLRAVFELYRTVADPLLSQTRLMFILLSSSIKVYSRMASRIVVCTPVIQIST